MAFRNIVGHRTIVALLSRSIARQTLPPSLLFAGPAGIGKRRVADAVAQTLNCLSPVAATAGEALDACGTCAACARIARAVHPDVIVVEPDDKGSIKIDPIRAVVDRTAFRPFEGRLRVVIIDQADAMVGPAQNALLKTLEEPPSASMFLLLTARPDALLPTVRSRCPRVRFQPLSADDVANVLGGLGHSDASARAMALTAGGSVERALAEDASELVVSRDLALRVLAQAATSDDPRRRLEIAKELVVNTGAGGATDRQLLATHLRMMAALIRDVELLGVGGDLTALANADLQSTLAKLREFVGERGDRAFSTVDRGLAALERNAGVKTVADWVALNL